MGLSDKERTSYIYHAIEQIINLSNDLKENFEYKKVFRKHADSLWPSVLGKMSNGAHWILGSSAFKPIGSEDQSVYAVAITDKLSEERSRIERKKDKFQHEFDPVERLGVFSYIMESGIEFADSYAKVYSIFGWTEQLVYALRRYDDDYLKRFAALSDVVSRIQGSCYAAFQCPVFAKAYVAHEIIKMIYSRRKPAGAVYDIFNKTYLHHDLQSMIRDYEMEDILQFHKNLIKDSSDANRIYVALSIAGKRFYYEHKLKELIGLIQKSKIKIDINKINQIFKENCKKKKDKDSICSNQYAKNKEDDINYVIHGELFS